MYTAKATFGILYLLLGWQIDISGWAIPDWLVMVATVVDGYLAYTALKLAK
ncbi:hypothetical protein HY439_01630 [Candidatus Microgenomates bacterium]|nr:hypothetical protein [Candidatus Microgenomates bacterium]